MGYQKEDPDEKKLNGYTTRDNSETPFSFSILLVQSSRNRSFFLITGKEFLKRTWTWLEDTWFQQVRDKCFSEGDD